MRPILVAALVLAFAAAGCGSAADDAKETVSTAVSSLAKGDAQRVCDQITPAAQAKLLKVLAHNPIGAPIHAATCTAAVAAFHAQLSKPIRAVLEDGEVEDARVDGDRATVHVVGAGMDVELHKISGRWKITGGFFN